MNGVEKQLQEAEDRIHEMDWFRSDWVLESVLRWLVAAG